MASYINEHGKVVLTGDDALRGLLAVRVRLLEGRKLHYKTSFQDIPISVENRKGSVRSGTDPDGDEWKTKMKVPYGYIPGTKGVDGDALDVFVGPDKDAAYAYIVHCNTPDGEEFDEDKIMLGFESRESAERCFKQHYDDSGFFGGIDAIPMWKFDDIVWVKKKTTKKLVASRGGASLQVPQDMFEKIDQFGRGTDQNMAKSILGHHQDIMVNPAVREHGVQGQKWGVRKPDLEHDPRTLSMMQVVKRTQPQLNAIRVWQKNRAARIAAQNQQVHPSQHQHIPSQHENHNEALEKLKELGWHALGIGARLTGLEGAMGVAKSVLQHASGATATMTTSRFGTHTMKPFSRRHRGMRTSVRESNRFRESKTYYARSMDQYETDAEESDHDLIREAFGGSINSPRTKRHAELGMGYFHKKIDAAKRVVIKPVYKRRVTTGVFSEAVHALKRGKPVYAIYKGKLRRVKSVEALDDPNSEGHFGKLIFRKKRKYV
jgi:hypothetical protein